MIKLMVRASLCTFLLLSFQAYATSVVIVNADGPGEGLNSSAPVAPVPGNNATSLGAQYLNVFRAAAAFWESRISSAVPIRVQSRFDPQFCNATSAQLGGAGPFNAFINFDNAPLANTVYTVAQANSLAGFDLDPREDDIRATFNSLLNGNPSCLGGTRWWLGIDSPAPRGTISLFDTVLHEIGHGLGFLTFVDQNGNRIRNFDGQAFNDTYMLNLFDLSQNRAWSAMTNGQRRASSINNGGLVWTGPNVDRRADVFTGGRNGGLLRMYAPSTFEPGSSVSHWDTAVSPDELMEPFATITSNACATILALKDMGWRTRNECGSTAIVPPIILLLDD